MKPVNTQAPLPYPGRGTSLPELADFDRELVRALTMHLGELAQRLNAMLPKDGTEGLARYTVDKLPSGNIGAIAYASNGRKSGEGAGDGTGLPVYYDGSSWKTFSGNVTVTA